MARVFKRKDRLSAMSEINLTSLMDLVFCLLIIFMITTPLMNEQSIPVDLPKEPRNPSSTRDPKVKFVSVTIDRNGRIFLDHDPVTLDQLRTSLTRIAAEPDQPAIDMREDPTVTAQQQDDVLNLINELNFAKIHFATQIK